MKEKIWTYNVYYRYIPFCLLACMMLILHSQAGLIKDDIFFSRLLSSKTLSQIVQMFYWEESSRIFVHAVTVEMYGLNLWIWRIMDTAMVVLFSILIYYLFDFKRFSHGGIIVCGMFLLYPFYQMRSAGWVTTTLNYIWPATMMLLACVPIKKCFIQLRVTWYEYVVYFIATVYASNAEQMAGAMFMVYTSAIMYFIMVEKRRCATLQSLWLIWIIVIGSIVFIFTCPGNYARAIADLSKPIFFSGLSYADLHVIDKVILGITSTIEYVLSAPDLVYGVLFLLIFYQLNFVNKTHISRQMRFCGSLPFFSIILSQIFVNIQRWQTHSLLQAVGDYQGNRYVLSTVYNFTDVTKVLPTLFSVLFITCICVGIYYSFSMRKQARFMLFVFLVCLVCRCVMGFSPSVFYSGVRTFFPIYIGALIIITNLYFEIENQVSCHRKRLNMLLVIFLSCISYIVSLYVVIFR